MDSNNNFDSSNNNQSEEVNSVSVNDVNSTQSVEVNSTQSVDVNGTNNIQNNSEVTNNKKVPKYVVILAWVGLICAILFLGYSFVFNSPKNIVKNSIDKFFKAISNNVNEISHNSFKYDLEKESIGIDGVLQMSSDYKGEDLDLTSLSNYKFNYKAAIDKKNNKAIMSFDIDENTSKLLDISGNFVGNNLFLNFNDIYSKLIRVEQANEIKDLSFDKSINSESLIKLINKTNSIIKNNINSKDIKKESVKKTINGKESTYKMVSYTINLVELEEKIAREYSNDDEIVKILSDLYNVSEKELKGKIDEFLKELDEDSTEEDNNSQLIINNYSKGISSSILETELLLKRSYYGETETISLVIYKDKDFYNYMLSSEDEEVLRGIYNPKTKTFGMYMGNVEENYINLNVTIDKDYIKGNLDTKSDNFRAEVDFNSGIIIEKDKQSQESNVDLKFTVDNEIVKMKITNNLNLNKNIDIKDIDQSNMVDYENLSEEEISNIYNSVLEKISSILDKIVSKDARDAYLRKIQ